MKPTAEQQAAIDGALVGKSLVINACAGSGKTSTLIAVITAFHAANPTTRILACMFNKAAQTDFAARLDANAADVRTTHSLAYQTIIANNPRIKTKLNSGRITRHKIADLLALIDYRIEAEIISAEQQGAVVYQVVQNFQQSASLKIEFRHMAGAIPEGSLINQEPALKRHLLDKAAELWAVMSDPEQDFPIQHDTYLKMWQLTKPVLSYGLVMVDEAQDTNPVVADIFENYAAQGGQIILVGDEKQSIYAFRGAVDAMDEARKLRPDIETLYLTQSFRFGQGTANLVNRLLKLSTKPFPEIRGNPAITTEAGAITEGKHCVLCRTNAGAIAEALRASRAGQQPHIVGNVKELATLLESAYYLFIGERAKVTAPQFQAFNNWNEFVETCELTGDPELERIKKLVEDERDPLAIVEILNQAGRIKEKDADVIISTAHKSKGREWPQVKLGEDFKSLLNDQGDFSGNEQELNLLYVAATRAQRRLQINGVLNLALNAVTKILEKLTSKPAATPEPRAVPLDTETAAWLAAYNEHDPDSDPDFIDPDHARKMNRAKVAAHKEQQRAAGRVLVKFFISQKSADAVLQRYREKSGNPRASKQDAFEDLIELALSGQKNLFDASELRRELSRLLQENMILRESEASAQKQVKAHAEHSKALFNHMKYLEEKLNESGIKYTVDPLEKKSHAADETH